MATLDTPYTLASLPHPLNAAGGKVLVQDVFSVSGSKKRKRAEVVVAIDGESVNIYDVQMPRLVTSYALPPQSSFTCPPCCLRTKPTRSSAGRRFTYVSTHSTKSQVTLFSETRTDPLESESTTTATFNIPNSFSPVVHLDIIPSTENSAAHDLLLVHERGEIQCLSGDLSQERWSRLANSILSLEPSGQTDPNLRLDYACLTDSENSRQGLLRGREDVLAVLSEGHAVDHHHIPILVLISHSAAHQGDNLHILSLRPNSPLQLLCSRLPQSNTKNEFSNPEYSLDPSSGTLYQLLDGQVNTIDLSGTLPRLAAEFRPHQIEFTSFLRLSPSSILAASSSSVGVYDLKYRSLQASFSISDGSDSAADKKRKHDNFESSTPIQLLTHISKLGVAVGLAGNELVGFQVSLSGSNGGRRKQQTGLLVDSLHRGIQTDEAKKIQPSHDSFPGFLGAYITGADAAEDDSWRKAKSDLDRYASRGDIRNFERVFADQLGIERDGSQLKKWKDGKSVSSGVEKDKTMVNGVGAESPADLSSEHLPDSKPLPDWKFNKDVTKRQKSILKRPVDRQRALYALSKIFECTNGQDQDIQEDDGDENTKSGSTLTIVFFPPNVAHWLLGTGLFSPPVLAEALHEAEPDSPLEILPEQFVDSIVRFDPEMGFLVSLLSSPCYLGPAALVQAIRHVMRSLEFAENPRSKQLLLTNSDEEPLTNGDLDQAISREAALAVEDLDLALSTLDHGSAIRGQALTLALTKLHDLPPKTITKALRRGLSRPEIIALIHLLRIELASGGWTSRYLDADFTTAEDDDDDGDNASDHSVTLIGTLLNSALDAIGAGGWLSGGDTADAVPETEALVTFLKAEVSAALEGIEEATYLRGLLDGLLRYGKSITQGGLKKAVSASSTTAAALAGPQPDAIASFVRSANNKPVTLALPTDEEGAGKFLPLGLRAEAAISRTRVGAGGEIIKRSARDVGREKSMRVGKYSFERIFV
ncbi:MAG: hypothetical protein M1819_000438 [Sarea resinae]|nr:MAG: hypothetical protein M1819_000438 [Sarea resinae]